MTRAIFGPTFEEMLHPSATDPAVRRYVVAIIRLVERSGGRHDIR
jgi:hypothetical protein